MRFAPCLGCLPPPPLDRTAVKSRHLASIKTAIAKCEDAGIHTGMDVEVAKRTMVELEREEHKVGECCFPFGGCRGCCRDQRLDVKDWFLGCFADCGLCPGPLMSRL